MKRSNQLSDAQIQGRREALLAAERSGMMDGMPPNSLNFRLRFLLLKRSFLKLVFKGDQVAGQPRALID